MKKTTKGLFIIAILTILNIFYYIGRWGGDTLMLYISDGLPIVYSFIAAYFLFMAVKSFKGWDLTRISWLLLFIGIVLNFIAESTYAILEIGFKYDMNTYFPSLADVFWCIGYIPMIIGLLLMLWNYKKSEFPMGSITIHVIIILGILTFFIALSYFLILPIISDDETSMFEKIFYLYYPIGDFMLVVPSIILIYITSLFGVGSISHPWRMLTIGFICFTFADLLYAYLSWNDLYINGSMVDVFWHTGYLLIGLSGLYQKELLKSIN